MSQSPHELNATQQTLEALQKVLPLNSLENLTTLIAVSGGPDSVALVDLIVKNKTQRARICLAHFNHRLRGSESDGDQLFVTQLADSLNCELFVGHSRQEISETNRGQGLESLARTERYQFLEETASRIGARFVLTAHTLDDRVETVVHRFFRGTGIRGMAGIQPIRELLPGVSLVRPLLGCTKETLNRYLKENELEFRVDSSNRSNLFTRNRIRAELLPLANEIFENGPSDAVLSFANQCRELSEWIDSRIESIFDDSIELGPQHVLVQLGPQLNSLPEILINEVWINIWNRMNWPRQQMNREKWQSVTRLAFGDKTSSVRLDVGLDIETSLNNGSESSSESGRNESASKLNLPGNLLAERRDGRLTIWVA